MKPSLLSEHHVATSEPFLPHLKCLLRKIIWNLECCENKIIFIVERLILLASFMWLLEVMWRKVVIKCHIAGYWCGSGDRGGNSPWEKIYLLLPSFRSSGDTSSSSVPEGGGTVLELVPRGNAAWVTWRHNLIPCSMTHGWTMGETAISYIVEMHLLLYTLGKSVYQQYTTRYVFCKWLGGCLQGEACEAQSERGPTRFDLGICILHMHSLFTHARPEEWRFMADLGSKVTWTTNREEAEGLVKSGHWYFRLNMTSCQEHLMWMTYPYFLWVIT